MMGAAKIKREAGQVVPPPLFPLTGNPASLTEGDQPVVCWPTLYNPGKQKKVPEKAKKVTRITLEDERQRSGSSVPCPAHHI
jgi:hypothetical protein